MTPGRHRFAARYGLALVVAASFLTLLGPFLVCSVPPLTDYPNHLARYWLIAGGALDPTMARFYRVDWANAATNIGVDGVAALLSPFVSGLLVGHVAIILAAVTPPLGVLAINLAVFRRLSPWQALFPFAAWSTTFLMGFVNFQIGLGLALLLVAGDPLLHPRLGRAFMLMRIPIGLLLATDHLFALIYYAILLAGLGFGGETLLPWNTAAMGRRIGRAALAAAWCLIPLAIMLAYAHALPGAQAPEPDVITGIRDLGGMIFEVMPGKLATLFSPLASYDVEEEMIVAVALLAVFVWLNILGVMRAHAGLLIAAAGLVLLAVVSPSRAAGASWVDRRFPIMALFCLLAALQPRAALPKATAFALGLVSLSFSVVQASWVAWNWRAMAANMESVRRVLASVPAGAAILPVQHYPPLALRWHAPPGRYAFSVGDPTFRHFDALAVPLRHAFIPNMFAAKGLQPLRVVGPWEKAVEHNGGDLASIGMLLRPPSPSAPSYIPGWRTRFDYVLVLNADMPDVYGPFHAPSEMTLVDAEGFAELWKITRPAAPAAEGPAIRPR